jgi:hypothetical protein
MMARAVIAATAWVACPGGVAGQVFSGGAPDGHDLFAAEEWGDERDGLRLRLGVAWAAEERYAADGLLRLAVQVRNTSSAPIEFDFSAINYDIAYEIDGVWYERDKPAILRPTVVAISPGAELLAALAIFLDDRYLLHGLSRIEGGAPSPLTLAANGLRRASAKSACEQFGVGYASRVALASRRRLSCGGSARGRVSRCTAVRAGAGRWRRDRGGDAAIARCRRPLAGAAAC